MTGVWIGVWLALAAVVIAILAVLLHLFRAIRWAIRETQYDAYFKRPLAERRALQLEMAQRARSILPLVRALPRWLIPKPPSRAYKGVQLPTIICKRTRVEQALAYQPDAGDIFVATQMKCGTTWAQQIVYEVLLRGQGDLSDSGHIHMYATSPWIESAGSVRLEDAPRIGAAQRRIIKTHLPASLCPYSDSARYVYVIRHPVACFSSAVDFTQMLAGPFALERARALDWFCSDEMWWGSWASHVEGWWQWAQARPNVLFLHYEHMLDDLAAAVDQVAALLDVKLEADERAAVVEKSDYRYMKAHEDVFEMAAPTFFSAAGTGSFFVSGKRDRGSQQGERERIAAFCRKALDGASYPLAHYYPDLIDPAR